MDNKEIRRANMLMLIGLFGSQKNLAEATGTPDPAHLSQIKNKVRDMGDDVARRFEDRLQKPHGWMDTLHVGAMEPSIAYSTPKNILAGPVGFGVPVVGTAQLGDDGYWLETEHPTGHGEGFVQYPTKDQNAYALRVKGDSMRPRIKPGEFVVIEPNHAVVPGDEVMVKTKDGRSMVKLLGSRRNGLVELLSINEDHRPITLDEAQVDKMHYVGGIIKASLYYKDV